jgi:ubiquinone/menaquinone biosynthesis C-methylase UbiE
MGDGTNQRGTAMTGESIPDEEIRKLVTLNSYDVSASAYARNTADLHPREDAKQFIRSLPSHAKIIDIGCGPGRDAEIFSAAGIEVVGIDFSPKMIEAAKQNSPESTFYVMDIEKISFPAESFDGAWASCALLHIPKKSISAVLDKIHLILKPEGSFYLSVKQSDVSESFEEDSRYGGITKYWSFYEPNELTYLLLNSGFKVVDLKLEGKSVDYQTHQMIKIFAKKDS